MHSTIRFLFIIYCFLLLNSCTVLQWRSSDEEIKTYFKTKAIYPKISYFSVDSLDLDVRVQQVTNSKNKINIVFLHGSPSSLSAWNGYFNDSLLRHKANLYAIDRPGYGYSNFGDEMPSITKQSEIINALISNYELKNVITIGSSYGGPLASRLAVNNTNIKGAIMISAAIDPNQEKKIWASHFTQWWLTRWLVPTSYRVAGDEKTIHAKELARIAPDWHKVQIPVLHIHGDKDKLVPYTNVNYSKSKFKNITVVTLAETGHEIAWARPELVIPHILKLTQQISSNIQ